jgi:hypothetical protein
MGSQLPMEGKGLAEVSEDTRLTYLFWGFSRKLGTCDLILLQRAKFLSFWSINSWPAGVPNDTPVPRDPEAVCPSAWQADARAGQKFQSSSHSHHSGWRTAAVLSSLITGIVQQPRLDVKGEVSRMAMHSPLHGDTEITASCCSSPSYSSVAAI